MVRLSMSKWKDKSHCIEMLIKAKDFLNTSMPCYYKAGTINKGKRLIRITLKYVPSWILRPKRALERLPRPWTGPGLVDVAHAIQVSTLKNAQDN